MKERPELPLLYHQIVEVIKPSAAFLVGGAVRDLLMGIPIHDLDFTLPKDTIRCAKNVADRLNGDYYLLDKERQAGRVLLQDEKNQRLMVDFTTFQGETIEEDLQTRDFTITSMAIDISHDQQIIDPFQGARDLNDGLIRSTTKKSLQDDPLRSLRAVRMASQLGFFILPDTKTQILDVREFIRQVSPERIRDELFRMLAGPNQAAAFQTLQVLGFYPLMFSGEFTSHQQNTLQRLEELLSVLRIDHTQDTAANWTLGLFVHRLGRFRKEIQTHFKREPIPGRSIFQLCFLNPLLHSVEIASEKIDPSQRQYSSFNQDLQLSNQEIDLLEKGIRAASASRTFNNTPSPLEVYRYFRNFGEAGVEGIFLALAHFLAVEEKSALDSGWPKQLDNARTLLEGWWEKRDQWVDPPSLMNGDDLQAEFDLDPGPKIGNLLEELREAQVQDGIQSRDKAKKYLKQLLDS